MLICNYYFRFIFVTDVITNVKINRKFREKISLNQFINRLIFSL